MTDKMNAIGGLSAPVADREKWYVKLVHRTFRIFQAVEHLMMRFLEVEPIYPSRH